jgi:2-polyprenyl-3-methyl-5-hydroxy-6-metoxy-1,4-benzoquinol methylase
MLNNNNYYAHSRPEMIKFVSKKHRKILDVGCGEGCFSSLLRSKRKNIEIWGIEMDSEAVKKSTSRVDHLIFGDVNRVVEELPDNYFECIIFNDVLEHMADPYCLLEKIKSKLSSDGTIVCSIPNVRHIRVLRDLLIKKNWRYSDAGVLDRTHLRFFTKKSIIEMFDNLNYNIVKMEGIHATSPFIFIPFNIINLGFFSDSRFIQFACVVKPKKNYNNEKNKS